MTMPHLMNCSHSGEGWCIDCVREQHNEIEAIETQRDALLAACQELIACLDPFSGDVCFQSEDSARSAVVTMIAAMKSAANPQPKDPNA